MKQVEENKTLLSFVFYAEKVIKTFLKLQSNETETMVLTSSSLLK